VGQPQGGQAIATLQVRYDDPALNQTGLLTETIPVEAMSLRLFQTAPNPQVHTSWRWRSTAKLSWRRQSCNKAIALGRRRCCKRLKTALQMGDKEPQPFCKQVRPASNPGEDLTDADRKKTRIVSKTVLQE